MARILAWTGYLAIVVDLWQRRKFWVKLKLLRSSRRIDAL
jgi:hypothetical protein